MMESDDGGYSRLVKNGSDEDDRSDDLLETSSDDSPPLKKPGQYGRRPRMNKNASGVDDYEDNELAVDIANFFFHGNADKIEKQLVEDAYDESKADALECPMWFCLCIFFCLGITIPLLWPVATAVDQASAILEGNLEFNKNDFFDSPTWVIACEDDAPCQFVMDALKDDLTADMIKAMEPDSCQLDARDWLKRSRDLYSYTPHRIRQRYGLYVFFCETNGEASWLQNRDWIDANLHECDWFNADDLGEVDPCDREENLMFLNLPENQLSGTLPAELSLLSTLHGLTLNHNFIKGTIPQEYIKLTDLDTIDLSFNFLEGTIPDYVFQLPDMVHFDLSQNDFEGTVPYTTIKKLMQKMPDLESFALSGNKKLEGDIPPDAEDLN